MLDLYSKVNETGVDIGHRRAGDCAVVEISRSNSLVVDFSVFFCQVETFMSAARKRRRPLPIAACQEVVRWFFRVFMTLVYRIRVYDLVNFPTHDGLLICSNHQSFLDPLILGVVCPRPVNYLGRKTLFQFAPLGWFLKWNDTIAIDRESTGIGGMKETLRRIKRGESVLMFPEGTRTYDGEFHQLMSGFCILAKRSKATLMPIGFDGAFQAYPRQHKTPQLGHIHVVMGKPIPFDEYASLTDEQTTELLASRIRTCFETARAHWRRSSGYSK